MKKNLKTRFSLQAFFATLLRPFTSDSPTDVPGLFGLVESRTDLAAWQILLMSTHLSLQCRLKRATYCKCNRYKQHEFLLLHFRHWNSESAVATVVIERVPKQDPGDNSSSKLIHTSNLISPSASETIAHDVVCTFSQGSTFLRYFADAYTPFTQLHTLDFPPLACPSAAQISILLSVVNEQAPNYHLHQNQRYWFSFTVWETLKKLFPDSIEMHNTPIDQRSHYCGLAIQKADSVEAVCRDYGVRWRNIENKEELKRKADEAKERQLYTSGMEQGLAQGLALAQGLEQGQAELDRMQTEINELQAALSESTRYSAEQKSRT
ncbi:hypothetical protein DEU56DRAFT_826620 [Suillus clintonianus]|uniref:uncharacterized protein n=1 Tax=Suillus clintonianus TaxID=1904413 RepID=UPI001B87F85E|nr:uncharacterized protein DEU56DRAFT_826620 [Suillus clintonianus]KAG2124808.1 hypothetical protein DEU56DRAFT_826620 [Suillus clintonianus]